LHTSECCKKEFSFTQYRIFFRSDELYLTVAQSRKSTKYWKARKNVGLLHYSPVFQGLFGRAGKEKLKTALSIAKNARAEIPAVFISSFSGLQQ
jgi:hypothetical protein